jgi:CarD family transcriptional regulator
MFELSSTVVYPGYGVAKISREVLKNIGETEFYFYELNFINKDVKVLVPKLNLDLVGVRFLSDYSLVQEVLLFFLEDYRENWFQDILMISWNRRSKDYQNKIRSGGLRDIASVYKDLKYIEKMKQLSFGEKSLLLQVESLFCEEIAEIYQRPFSDVVKFVAIFVDSCLSEKKKSFFQEYVSLGRKFDFHMLFEKGDVLSS